MFLIQPISSLSSMKIVHCTASQGSDNYVSTPLHCFSVFGTINIVLRLIQEFKSEKIDLLVFSNVDIHV